MLVRHQGRFPFVRTGRPDHWRTSHFNYEIGFFRGFLLKNYLLAAHCLGFDWSGWIVLINSEILITTGMVWPVSSDKWKAPQNNKWRWRQNTTHRCGSTPVSTVLSLSVKFLMINTFSIIIIKPHTQTYGHPLLSAVLTYKIMYKSLCKNLFLIMKLSMDQLSPG